MEVSNLSLYDPLTDDPAAAAALMILTLLSHFFPSLDVTIRIKKKKIRIFYMTKKEKTLKALDYL